MGGKKSPKKGDKKAERSDKDSGEKSADDIRKEILIKNNLDQYMRVFKYLTNTVEKSDAPPPGVQVGDQALDTNACSASRSATPRSDLQTSRPASGKSAGRRSRPTSGSRPGSRMRPPSAKSVAGAAADQPAEGTEPEEEPYEPLELPEVETQLDFKQFAAMVRTLLHPTDITQPEMLEFFGEFDKEGKGHVNFEEYVAGIATTDFEIQETFRIAEEKARKKAAKEAKATAKAAKKAAKAKKKK